MGYRCLNLVLQATVYGPYLCVVGPTRCRATALPYSPAAGHALE